MQALAIKQKTKTFHDAWESLPDEIRRHRQRQWLREYVAYAQKLPFYRKRLRGYDAQGEHPLAQIPPLTANELRTLLPPASQELIADSSNGFNVFQSGGTTGNPKTTLFSHEELDGLHLPNSRGFYAVGLKNTDRVANLFAVGGLYMTFLHIHRTLEQYGCVNFPFSNHTAADFIHNISRLFKINCFTGISSIVLNCLRQMAKRGLAGIKIEKVYYGGEHLYEADKEEIREKFGAEIIAAPGYGTVDTWYIGYQCLDCPTGVFHAHDDQCYIEIIDENTGRPCAPGQIGMLYATPFPRKLTPIIRYRAGDLARWLKQPCACARTTPLFQLLGRGDDVLRIGFDSVDYNAVQKAVAQIQGLSGAVQMEKRRCRGRDELIIRVETEAPARHKPALKYRLNLEIEKSRPTLRKLIAEKIIWPIKIELRAPDSIARNSRTGKLERCIDFHASAA